MKLAIPNYVEKIMDEINKNNYECYLVGGCVRDALLNKEPNDYDIATNCDTSTLKKIFKNYELINNNGEKHNTLTIHYLNHNIEVTSYKYEDGECNTIEYDLLHLPKPDLPILLYMPSWASAILKKNRPEAPDQHELDTNYLKKSESVYLKLANRRNSYILNCTNGDKILSISEIGEILCKYVENNIIN